MRKYYLYALKHYFFMKTLTKYISVPALALSIAACTKTPEPEIILPQPPSQTTEITVYATQEHNTRATIEQSADGFSSVWQYGDRIGVFVNTMFRNVETNVPFQIDNLREGQTTTRGKFSGLVKDTTDIFAYYAYSPAANTAADPHEILSVLSSRQTSGAENPDPAANFMTARPITVPQEALIGTDASGKQIEFSFRRAFAIWGITLGNLPENETLRYITVSSAGGRTLAGEFSADITDAERFDDNTPVRPSDFFTAWPAIKITAPGSGNRIWTVMAPSAQDDEGYIIRAFTQSGVAEAFAPGFSSEAGGIYSDTLSLGRMKHYLLFEDFGIAALDSEIYMEDYDGFSRAGSAAASVKYSSGAAKIVTDRTGEGAFASVAAGDMLSIDCSKTRPAGGIAISFRHKGAAVKVSASSDGTSWYDAETVPASEQWTDSQIMPAVNTSGGFLIKLSPQGGAAAIDNIGILAVSENASTLRLATDSISVDNTVDAYTATVYSDADFTVSSSQEWLRVSGERFAAGESVDVRIELDNNEGNVRSGMIYFKTTDGTCSDTLTITQMGRPFHTGHELLGFKFLKKDNPYLRGDITLTADGEDTFSGRIPYLTDIRNLVPTFASSTMSRVLINGVEQKSGVSMADFTKKIVYTVVAENGDSSRYEISLVHFTGLPILYINTATGNPVAGKVNWEAATMYLDGGQNFDGYPLGEIYIKGRGNSSWGTFTKKQSYNVKLPERSKILGMPKHKRWSLIGNYRDKTLLRNQVSMELGRKTDLPWVPRCVQVELVLNGTHRGTYLLSEQIRIDKNRVAINEMSPSDTDPEAITGGYVMEWDQYSDSDVKSFYSQYVTGSLTGGRFSQINVKIPSIDDGNQAQFDYIENHFREAEEAVCNNGGNFSQAYDKYIDINSFADFWMVYELSATPEPARGPYSFYMYKDKSDSRFYAGPLWDFDFLSYIPSTASSWVNKDAGWYRYLFNDPQFKAIVKSRWNSHKEGFREVLESYIDSQQEYLRLSAEENWALYDLAERGENGDEHIPSDDAIMRMKNTLRTRLDWMDRQINSWTSNTASGGLDQLGKDDKDKDNQGFWK